MILSGYYIWQCVTNLCGISRLYPSISEAVKTIFKKATDKERAAYENQLENVEGPDPVLIITPNIAWINQYGLPAYNAVMDGFATNGLRGGRRRDENSRAIFHFPSVTELYTVRDNISIAFPNAFHAAPAFHLQLPNSQLYPIGTAWILTSVGIRRSDFGEDNRFFLIYY